ncbi:hypothetical protein Mapa_013814 [Marchantia paleacea]|nr:hypothetical protein Mapa_013814 [Marchantia paleacea]
MREPAGNLGGRAAMETSACTGKTRICLYVTDLEAGIMYPEMEVVFRDTTACTSASIKEAEEKREEQIFHPEMEKVFGDNTHWATLTDLEAVQKMTQSRGKSKSVGRSKSFDHFKTKRDVLEALHSWWNSIDSINCKPKRLMILALWFIAVAVFFMMILVCCIIVFVFTSVVLWGPMVGIIFFWLLPYCEQAQAQAPAYIAGLLTVCSAAICGFFFVVVVTDDSYVYKHALPDAWGTLCDMSGNSFSCIAAQHLIGYALFQAAHVCLFIVVGLVCYGMSSLWCFFCSD